MKMNNWKLGFVVVSAVALITLTMSPSCRQSESQAVREIATQAMRLQDSLQLERASLDQQQTDLNELREEIELDRRRAPVIAEAIHVIGGIMVCLCPLALAAYVLYSVNRTSAADEAQLVNEILIGEFTSETPRLLAPATGLAITDHCSTESVDPAEREPPF